MQMRNHLFMAEKGVPMDTTSLAVRSGVPSLHYSFGHFRYSQLKPILRIRKSQKKSRPPFQRNIHLQEGNCVFEGLAAKDNPVVIIRPIAPLGSLIHTRFLLGLRLVRKFNGKMFSVIQSPPDRWLIVQGADQRWKFSCSSLFWLACEQAYLCEFVENFGGVTRKAGQKNGERKSALALSAPPLKFSPNSYKKG